METQVLTPHVYWAQRHRELYLRVELSDVQVKARLRVARGIAAPGTRRPHTRKRSCSAPVEATSGVPGLPPGLQVPSGVPRVASDFPFVPGRRPGEPYPGPGGTDADSRVA